MIVKKETLYRFLKKATNNTSITRVSLIPTCSKIFKRIIYKLKQNGIKEKLLLFNRLFEKSPTKISFKWSVLIMDKGECWCCAAINFGTFIVFGLHKRLAKRFTV